MEDHCLALQGIFMKRHMHYLLVKLLQKSRLQMEYLKAQFSEKGLLLFIKGSVFLYLHQSVSMCFCPMSHIHFATICGVRSYGRSSYLLHGFGVVRRLVFHVRDQWSLFLSEVHAKLTRLVNAFSVQTSMFCLGVCTLQFEDSKGHWWCNPVFFILISSKICHFGHRILHRFWTTLQGSREDIGWLQRTQASLCSVDGTGRFKEILHEIRWFF